MEKLVENDLKLNNAYKEVICVLNHLIKDDYEKIPKDVIKFFEDNQNNDYEFIYDESKDFKDQVLLEESKYLLFNIFENYGATDVQKAKLASYRKNYYAKLEEEKREKFNPDNIFNNKVNNISTESESNLNSSNNASNLHVENLDYNNEELNKKEALNDFDLPVESKKEGIFTKIINFIKKFLK